MHSDRTSKQGKAAAAICVGALLVLAPLPGGAQIVRYDLVGHVIEGFKSQDGALMETIPAGTPLTGTFEFDLSTFAMVTNDNPHWWIVDSYLGYGPGTTPASMQLTLLIDGVSYSSALSGANDFGQAIAVANDYEGLLDHVAWNSNLFRGYPGTTAYAHSSFVYRVESSFGNLIDTMEFAPPIDVSNATQNEGFLGIREDSLPHNGYYDTDTSIWFKFTSISLRPTDTTPPEVTLTLAPNMLWPPSHRLVPIVATLDVRDDTDPHPSVTLVSITSNQSDSGLGADDVPNDIQQADFGGDDRAFLLRAERASVDEAPGVSKIGRIYTVTYRVADKTGNASLVSGTVVVPYSQAK